LIGCAGFRVALTSGTTDLAFLVVPLVFSEPCPNIGAHNANKTTTTEIRFMIDLLRGQLNFEKWN
jgi:hypothetical protein